jgi:hypothetical protein
MHAKIANHTVMGKRKISLKGPTKRVMMRVEPNIRVPINESPSTTTMVVNPITNGFLLMNHHLLPLKLLSHYANRVHVDESPSVTTEVVHPTIDSEGNGGGQKKLQGRPPHAKG